MQMKYSYNGQAPEHLPVAYLEADGTNHTSLQNLNEGELAALGFVQADETPNYDPSGWT